MAAAQCIERLGGLAPANDRTNVDSAQRWPTASLLGGPAGRPEIRHGLLWVVMQSPRSWKAFHEGRERQFRTWKSGVRL